MACDFWKKCLDYLSLDRLSSTLSEARPSVSTGPSLGSHLVGALYVLDEPSIGLHPRDTHRLIQILKHLRDLGNTLLVVEHDPDAMAAADYVIDLGPGAGEHGGKLLYAGPANEFLKSRESLTARYFTGEFASRSRAAAQAAAGVSEGLRGARHNLKNMDMMIPLE